MDGYECQPRINELWFIDKGGRYSPNSEKWHPPIFKSLGAQINPGLTWFGMYHDIPPHWDGGWFLSYVSNEVFYHRIPILVGGLEHFLFSHILGIIIPIDELIFFRGVAQPPTSNISVSEKRGSNPSFSILLHRWVLGDCLSTAGAKICLASAQKTRALW